MTAPISASRIVYAAFERQARFGARLAIASNEEAGAQFLCVNTRVASPKKRLQKETFIRYCGLN